MCEQEHDDMVIRVLKRKRPQQQQQQQQQQQRCLPFGDNAKTNEKALDKEECRCEVERAKRAFAENLMASAAALQGGNRSGHSRSGHSRSDAKRRRRDQRDAVAFAEWYTARHGIDAAPLKEELEAARAL